MAPQYPTILLSLCEITAVSCAALVMHGCTAVATPRSEVLLAGWDASTVRGGDAGALTWTDASACRPGDLQAYHPVDYRPVALPSTDACRPGANSDPIQLFFDSCLGPKASFGLCEAFKADKANAACAACILTPEAAPQYGVLVGHGGFISANVAGCLELTEPAGLACAKSIQALADCELAACEANCPVGDVATFAAYSTCASDADRGACGAYAAAAVCQGLYVAADGNTAPCLSQSFAEFYSAVAARLCAAPAPLMDAGPGDDGGADATD